MTTAETTQQAREILSDLVDEAALALSKFARSAPPHRENAAEHIGLARAYLASPGQPLALVASSLVFAQAHLVAAGAMGPKQSIAAALQERWNAIREALPPQIREQLPPRSWGVSRRTA